MMDRLIALLMSIITLISSFITGFIPTSQKLRIVVPENWELSVGDSRTLECVFSETVTDRALSWSVEPDEIATVDKWGRVTAKSVGTATVTAEGNGFSDSVELNVVETPTLIEKESNVTGYTGEGVDEVENLQKLVARFAHGDPAIPSFVSSATDYENHQTAVTADGVLWEITDYGVLRTDENAENERDKEQRYMGDRYFYSDDTSKGNVLAIFPDGEYGIWTVMRSGVTHIQVIEADGTLKATYLSSITHHNNNRHGLTAESYWTAQGWKSYDTDNDGLWTSMYGAGELMRYATMKNDPNATAQDIADAKATAYSAAEAVLMLYYIPMRSGTTEAYVRHQKTGKIPGIDAERWLSSEALEAGGDPSVMIPGKSPAQLFDEAMASFELDNSLDKLEADGFYEPVTPEDWSDPSVTEGEYETQTRLLEGLPARTYFLKENTVSLSGNIYWSVNSDLTATGVSSKTEDDDSYLLNGENLRGVTIDASKEVPQRLWNDLIGEQYSADDIIYKTDTSADELIGHMFIFKLMYDIIAPEDPELKELLVNAVDNLAQHISDNSYMLVDGTGQPCTWSNFGRTLFCNGSSVAESSLHSLVLLSIFKTAAYITGYEKWDNEYKMAALDPAYEYARVATQHYERMTAAIKHTVGNSTLPFVGNIVADLEDTELFETVYRFTVNYSAEEMAMLAFYTLFGLEDDENLLSYYREAIDDWWISMRYSENPLWYLVYQLAYPDKTLTDAYDNNILETAAWSLSRHPGDLNGYHASNPNRDDIGEVNLNGIGIKLNVTLSYNLKTSPKLPELGEDAEVAEIAEYILKIPQLDWAVAAPDEKALHKYNSNSYSLNSHHAPYCLNTSTTYTLPYWMGVYHGMIKR